MCKNMIKCLTRNYQSSSVSASRSCSFRKRFYFPCPAREVRRTIRTQNWAVGQDETNALKLTSSFEKDIVSLMSRSGLKRPFRASITSWKLSIPSQVTWIVLDMPGVHVQGDISRPVRNESDFVHICSGHMHRDAQTRTITYALHNATMHSLPCLRLYIKSQPYCPGSSLSLLCVTCQFNIKLLTALW